MSAIGEFGIYSIVVLIIGLLVILDSSGVITLEKMLLRNANIVSKNKLDNIKHKGLMFGIITVTVGVLMLIYTIYWILH